MGKGSHGRPWEKPYDWLIILVFRKNSKKSYHLILKKFIPTALIYDIVIPDFLNRTAVMAGEAPMEFTCRTTYDQKTLTAMARAIRKTVRAPKSRRVRLYAWVIIGLLLVSLWLSWGNVWQTAAESKWHYDKILALAEVCLIYSLGRAQLELGGRHPWDEEEQVTYSACPDPNCPVVFRISVEDPEEGN